ncbi:hypothetical protein L195_g035650 [Trifolium pratense]|uniref:Uncharacterized protein n=1 Tax=Trifolium pratense TaxID=57577 RepID=A0A2K3LMA8_TRIPR|nr:hypothetical protein L195_g035650 [Trifolium pratense]
MSEINPKTKTPLPPSSSSSGDHASTKFSGHKTHINPPETSIPDSATLRDQWKYAIRQYSKWYSHAWGTAILAGTAFFALGQLPTMVVESRKKAGSNTVTYGFWIDTPVTITS